jgi:hypothetical protein
MILILRTFINHLQFLIFIILHRVFIYPQLTLVVMSVNLLLTLSTFINLRRIPSLVLIQRTRFRELLTILPLIRVWTPTSRDSSTPWDPSTPRIIIIISTMQTVTDRTSCRRMDFLTTFPPRLDP